MTHQIAMLASVGGFLICIATAFIMALTTSSKKRDA